MVAGAVFANNFIAQRFTDWLALEPHPTDHERGLRQVAQVFVALQECIRDLETFYNNLKFDEKGPDTGEREWVRTPASGPTTESQGVSQTVECVPKDPLGRWVLPYRTGFEDNGKSFSLTYNRPLESGVKTTRALFIASMKSLGEGFGTSVVVKFARRYCPGAHRLLAKMSLAPQLIHHECTAGVHFVVMEHIKATQDTGKTLNKTGHAESLRRAVQALHGEGLVFGDLRGPNILIVGDGVKLVDFDWSGNEGVVHYPSHLSKAIEWPRGVESDGKIKAEHDKEWFKRLTGTEL